MRMTFSAVLCVLIVAACSAQTTTKDTKTEKPLLQQAIQHLKFLINMEKDNPTFLHSPTNDIQECCSQSALECFKNELVTFNPKQKTLVKSKLLRNLGKPAIMNSVNTCSEEEKKKVQCRSCKSYPMVSSKQFLTNLQSHLQKAYSRS